MKHNIDVDAKPLRALFKVATQSRMKIEYTIKSVANSNNKIVLDSRDGLCKLLLLYYKNQLSLGLL
jgi:hypothetical protein